MGDRRHRDSRKAQQNRERPCRNFWGGTLVVHTTYTVEQEAGGETETWTCDATAAQIDQADLVVVVIDDQSSYMQNGSYIVQYKTTNMFMFESYGFDMDELTYIPFVMVDGVYTHVHTDNPPPG